ncbi:hypothetical protein [Methylobacterium sp. 22177]|uniref:hypothetical protein n=1 Tax=Methylobacterium sp. 22177 TaxID=3453885 RepID=UPI003F862EFA
MSQADEQSQGLEKGRPLSNPLSFRTIAELIGAAALVITNVTTIGDFIDNTWHKFFPDQWPPKDMPLKEQISGSWNAGGGRIITFDDSWHFSDSVLGQGYVVEANGRKGVWFWVYSGTAKCETTLSSPQRDVISINSTKGLQTGCIVGMLSRYHPDVCSRN